MSANSSLCLLPNRPEYDLTEIESSLAHLQTCELGILTDKTLGFLQIAWAAVVAVAAVAAAAEGKEIVAAVVDG